MYIFKIIIVKKKKHLFTKSYLQKIYLQKVIFWNIGYWKNMYTYFVHFLKKICLQVYNFKEPPPPCPFMFQHCQMKHCFRLFFFLMEHQWMVQIACVLIFSASWWWHAKKTHNIRCDASCMLASPIFFFNTPEKMKG